MNTEPMNLDLAPVSVSVTYRGEEYELVEATEAVAAAFRNVSTTAARMEDGKLVGFSGLAEGAAVLVSGCLFKLIKTANGITKAQVPLAAVKAMPARVVKPLFERAKEISELVEAPATPEELRKQIKTLQDRLVELEKPTAETELGKEQAAGTATSA